jgi:SSS family solute:Na+ symporter
MITSERSIPAFPLMKINSGSQYQTGRLVFRSAIFLILLLPVFGMAQQNNFFTWKQLPSIPDPVGFAGAYAGVSNGALLAGGGANFPDGIGPWGNTKKTWYDQVYVLETPEGTWREAGKFSRPMGYGISLTWNDRVICAGGADGTDHYTNVWSWQWRNGALVTDTLPSLPHPLANASGVILNNTLYLAGGLSHPNDTITQRGMWSLELTLPQEKMVWKKQAPVPGPGRMLSVAGVQDEHLYIFSGVELYYDAVAGKTQRKYLTDAYRFHPQKGWEAVSDLPHAVAAAPSPAFTTGQSHLLIFGGDDGKLASRVMELKGDHPGFSSAILAYHTITNTWSSIGEVPQNIETQVNAPVTTPLIVWNGNVVLPGGEAKPGVRTTHVLQATPQTPTGTFKLFDWAVVGIYFVVILGISAYVSSRMNQSTENFFLGGKQIPWWAAGLSIFGSKLSALTFIAIPAKTYATDWVYIFSNMMIIAVVPIVILFFLPYFRKINITSVYEYLAIRFNQKVKLLGSLTFIIFQVGRLGIVIYIPALVLSTVTGINLITCIFIITIITTAYTIAGGIEAVIWTEVIQVVVLLGGAFLCFYFIADSVGGVDVIVSEAAANDKLKIANWGWAITEPVLWVVILGNFMTQLTIYTSDQVVVQRYLTTPTLKEAKQSIYTNALLVIPATLIFFSVGTALWVYFRHNPAMLNPHGRTDNIFPWYISQQLPAGLAGLVIAGLFAATMSTISSSMNSIATVATTDFYKHFRPASTDLQRFHFARWVTLALGFFGIAIAIWLVFLKNSSIWDQYLKLMGMFGGCLAGMFIGGIFFKSINSTGILLGLILSAVILFFIQAGEHIHFFLYPGIGIFGCIIFGLIFSRVFPDKVLSGKENLRL